MAKLEVGTQLIAAAAAVSLAACAPPAVAAAGPSQATIEQLIHKYQASPASWRIQFDSVRVANPRPAHLIYGIHDGVTVWPVLAKFTVFQTGGDDTTAAWSVCSRSDDTQTYYVYKNDFGDWGLYPYSSSENSTQNSHPYSPCSTMPGAEIFQSQ